MSEALLAENNEWNASHPKASFQELEEALHERLSRLEAQALQASVQARADSRVEPHPRMEAPSRALAVERRCKSAGSRSGICKGQAGTRRRCAKVTESVTSVGWGFSSQIEELGEVPGRLTPRHREHLVQRAALDALWACGGGGGANAGSAGESRRHDG
jgi:hypothetical protein